jgi:hypothetical protein
MAGAQTVEMSCLFIIWRICKIGVLGGGFSSQIVKKELLIEHSIAKVFSNVSYVVKFHTVAKFVTWLSEKWPENNGRASTKAHLK